MVDMVKQNKVEVSKDDERHNLFTVVKWLFGFFVIISLLLWIAIPETNVHIAIVVALASIASCFYFLHIGYLPVVRIIIGYGFPAYCTAAMALHKYWIGIELLDPVHYFATGVFLQFTLVIPNLIYPARRRSFWYNSIFILLLIVIREPINHILGFPISAVADNIKDYWLFEVHLVLISAFSLLYIHSKDKKIISHKVEYDSLNKDLAHNKFFKRVFDLDSMRIDPDHKIGAFLRIAKETFNIEHAFISYAGESSFASNNQYKIDFSDAILSPQNIRILTKHVEENILIYNDQHNISALNDSLGMDTGFTTYYGHAIFINKVFYGALHLGSKTSLDIITEADTQLFHTLSVHIQYEIQRKISEEESLQNEQLAIIAKETTNAVVVTDPAGHITWVNKGFTTITGYQSEEVIGKKPSKLLQGPDTDQNEVNKIRAAIQSGETCNVQLLNCSKDGRKYWIDIRLVPIKDDKGKIKQFIAIETDITLLKDQMTEINENRTQLDNIAQNLKYQSEKLGLALSTGDLIAWELDFKTDKMNFYPEGHEKIFFGRNERIQDSYTLLNEVIHQSHREICINQLNTQSRERFQCELETIGDSGEESWKHVTAQPTEFDEEGKVSKITGIFQDVSWKKRAETALIIGQEKERIRVSRDIHDSIGQMLVGTRMVLSEYLNNGDEEIPFEVDKLLEGAIRETRLIINNLSASYMESNSFYAAVDRLTQNLKKLSSAEIELNWTGEKTLSNPRIGIEIFRILQEGLMNAIKYSNANTISVDIINKASIIAVKISDNGIGFEYVPNDNSSGFGLNNMRNRANNIEADLKIESELGVGTTINIKRFL
ncbi:MAG: PAS domain S-box-containing protein [Cyclobacteriaceae bacterium]|jgi:PAS domain S-box-containing protein